MTLLNAAPAPASYRVSKKNWIAFAVLTLLMFTLISAQWEGFRCSESRTHDSALPRTAGIWSPAIKFTHSNTDYEILKCLKFRTRRTTKIAEIVGDIELVAKYVGKVSKIRFFSKS